MDKVIVIRYGELYLKGKNRSFFERILIRNIKNKLKDFHCTLRFGRSRYTVEEFPPEEETELIAALKTVFGLHSFSVAQKVPNDYKTVLETALESVPESGSFRVNVNRADKTYPLTSVALAAKLGEDILLRNPRLNVDLHAPDFSVNVDIRETGDAFVYSDRSMGAGGMPVGSAGKGLLMLSGGIDSPVAGYCMAKRGLSLEALHFHSYPYTGELAKEKVIRLAKLLETYCGKIKLLCIPVTHIQEEIHKKCGDSYMITILRRFMMRIAERLALDRGCGCLINGESLGQVASQTLESITVTNSTVEKLPVFRPLIGMDKQEIIDIAERIGTYETSIQPYEDCCTVFLPENPATRPTLMRAALEEEKLGDIAALLDEAVRNLEVIEV